MQPVATNACLLIVAPVSVGVRFVYDREGALDHDAAAVCRFTDGLQSVDRGVEAVAAYPDIGRTLRWRKPPRHKFAGEVFASMAQGAFVEKAVDEGFHG